ncbi:hypothetical protein ECS88_2540 [Escherichia coli S88]|nr:hypothetical protein ECS88_2540 [Escherichia coli S88]
MRCLTKSQCLELRRQRKLWALISRRSAGGRGTGFQSSQCCLLFLNGVLSTTTWLDWHDKLLRFSPIKNARRQPSVLIKYKWNFNNIQRGNYMRNKGFNPPDTHKEAKRLRFLRSIDERTQISFVKVARTELLKAEARALLPSLPKEEGYTFIPNAFLEKLLKEDISVSQFNDVLKVFRQGR